MLLTGSSAEMKSYAYAATALILLFLVPLYGFAFRQLGKQQLTRYVSGFFLLNLAAFFLLGRAGVDIGFAYYVWVGIFNVLITAQFWAFAADSFNVKSGKRLFPLIMIGATLGGLVAPWLSGTLFPTMGPWLLLLAGVFFVPALVALKGPSVLSASHAAWGRGAIAAFASLASYLIAVWAMTKAPIALVAALRETSILFAVLIGWLIFGERMQRSKAVAAVVIVAGIVLTRV